MVRIIVSGSQGRMGQRIIKLADASSEVKIVGEVDKDDRLEQVIDRGDRD